jgi:hypothetical protein
VRGSLLVVVPVSGQRALASPMAKRELEQRGPREDRSRLVGPTSATPIRRRRRRRTSFSGSLLEVVQLDNAAVQRKECCSCQEEKPQTNVWPLPGLFISAVGSAVLLLASRGREVF